MKNNKRTWIKTSRKYIRVNPDKTVWLKSHEHNRIFWYNENAFVWYRYNHECECRKCHRPDLIDEPVVKREYL